MIKIFKYPDKMFLQILTDLEGGQLTNGQIAEKYGCSKSTIEAFNGCKIHTELHSYNKNIRREANNLLVNCINEYVINENGICELKITNAKKEEAVCLFDFSDLEIIKQHSWIIRKDKQGNYRVKSEGKDLHQFLFEYDDSMVIDHIDRNPLNNCRNNLRIVSPSINSTNARPKTENKSGIRGVYFRPARLGISRDSWYASGQQKERDIPSLFHVKNMAEMRLLSLPRIFVKKN